MAFMRFLPTPGWDFEMTTAALGSPPHQMNSLVSHVELRRNYFIGLMLVPLLGGLTFVLSFSGKIMQLKTQRSEGETCRVNHLFSPLTLRDYGQRPPVHSLLTLPALALCSLLLFSV